MTILSCSFFLSSGLPQSGLASAIAQSIALLPEDLQGMFWANIGLIGGTTKFPGSVNDCEFVYAQNFANIDTSSRRPTLG